MGAVADTCRARGNQRDRDMTKLTNAPVHGPNLPETTRSLPIAMLRARETMMAPIRQMLQKAGVTEQQWRVLRVLAERGTMDPKDLAHAACLLNPSLTRIMQLLERKADHAARPSERPAQGAVGYHARGGCPADQGGAGEHCDFCTAGKAIWPRQDGATSGLAEHVERAGAGIGSGGGCAIGAPRGWRVGSGMMEKGAAPRPLASPPEYL